LADAQAEGARIEILQRGAVEPARDTTEEVVFFASGRPRSPPRRSPADPPPNFTVLSAHKYIPPVMEIVAEMPGNRVEGFLAAGHAAAITGSAIFDRFVAHHRIPVVVAGFEPLDILAGLVKLSS
jgi:hydrogenase expression/formation protein HypD